MNDEGAEEIAFGGWDGSDYSDESEEVGPGMELTMKQTTFSNLKDLIPKGALLEEANGENIDTSPIHSKRSGKSHLMDNINPDDIASEDYEEDYYEEDDEPLLFHEIEGISANNNDGPVMGVAPCESLSMLKIRNQDKWKEIGYDPSHGKGDMRGSVTLSGFKPTSLLAQIQSDSSTNSIQKLPDAEVNPLDQLLHDDANKPLPISRPHPQIKRVNSSEGPAFHACAVVDSSSTDTDIIYGSSTDVDSNFLDPDDIPWQPTYLNLEEEDYADPNFVPGSITDLIQNPIVPGDSFLVTKFHDPDEDADKENRQSFHLSDISSKPETTQTTKTVKKEQPKKIIKKDKSFSEYDSNEIPDYSHVPPRLLKMIHHKKQSIVFRAICGESLGGQPKNLVKYVLSELKPYLEMCISQNMIGESSFMDATIQNIKAETRAPPPKKENNYEQKLNKTQEILEKRKENWQKKKNALKIEEQLALENLDLRLQDELEKLEEDWNSERMQTQFNKPSPKLIAMRQHAIKMISAHEFEEAKLLAIQIQKQEDAETNEASVRMNLAYRTSRQKLVTRFENEKESVKLQFESKFYALEHTENEDLHGYKKRIQSLQKSKETAELHKDKKEDIGIQKKIPIFTSAPPITLNAKLKLPPLGAVNRRISSSQSSNISNSHFETQ